ncbi:hypothetical protein LQG66_35965 [Bradyrhizobium ontarionense]|uniref:Flagellar protein FlgN n=1 Tax=Bradyrhizobium ontarionense TaxID=2898149 RepID=A0ABY3RCP6_9BRAD|nr:hypothetical protein [Bradyrhizobium sp. A19]UFZ04522.1 hypothetical protein LQG66_35965 [Bradyrhizobium sp. A19]
MTAQGQAKKTSYSAVATVAEARALADEMVSVMSELITVIEQETELVRAGKLREGMALGPNKTELSRHYVAVVGRLKASQPFMKQSVPELLGTLHRHHDTFRAMLQVNLTVLATAHAISEKIVRGVNAEIQRKNIPSTYTASGRRAAPGGRHLTPLAVSRTL